MNLEFDLSEDNLATAIRKLEQYKRKLLQLEDGLTVEVAENIQREAQRGFNTSYVDDLLPQSGSRRSPEVTVELERSGDGMNVIARGEDAVWVEFGAGVYHNGATGTSPRPNAGRLTIGSYGSKGKLPIWGFYDESGALRLTHGTPAQMPMYKAKEMVKSDIPVIIRRLFEND